MNIEVSIFVFNTKYEVENSYTNRKKRLLSAKYDFKKASMK